MIIRCAKTGGQKALDNWLKAQENLLWCVMQNFHVLSIKDEIEAKKATGDLDLVFKKYCGYDKTSYIFGPGLARRFFPMMPLPHSCEVMEH